LEVILGEFELKDQSFVFIELEFIVGFLSGLQSGSGVTGPSDCGFNAGFIGVCGVTLSGWM
jgi:hypothetical protein